MARATGRLRWKGADQLIIEASDVAADAGALDSWKDDPLNEAAGTLDTFRAIIDR